jgi:hypothetical protein
MSDWAYVATKWVFVLFATAFISVLIGCCISSTVRTACVVNGLGVLLWSTDKTRRSKVERTTDGTF